MCAIVTVHRSFGISSVFITGTDQAEEVFKRDAKRIGNQARAAGKKAKQTVRGKR